MASTGYHHIELRDDVPWIRDTQIKVIEIAEDVSSGWDGLMIHQNYPWISLPQIYSAFAYYFEHKDGLDQELARREQFDRELMKQYHDQVFETRLEQARVARAALGA